MDRRRRSRRGAARGSETILLVEDEAALRSLVAESLQSLGYTVLPAGHAAEALLAADQHPGPIQLMLTDVVMPGIGGRELAEKLGASRRQLKVLYISGYTDDAVFRHGILSQGMEFLQKPFTVGELSRRVRQVLDGSAAPRRA